MSEADALISIVIPAYNRRATLFEAIQSCLSQRHRPLEIIVGDDSSTDACGEMVAALTMPEGVTLRYRRHPVQLGQSGQLNWLFAEARGARTMLLHDDDYLWPGGLDRLIAAWRAHPGAQCVFGKQAVVLDGGELDIDQTLAINRRYGRADRPTMVLRPRETVGLLQQMPNNCYLIETALARAIGYRAEAEVGLAADADFAIRVTLAADPDAFVLVGDYVSTYRISRRSMMRLTRRNQDHHLFFRVVEALALPPEAEAARALCLARVAPGAVLDAANAGRPDEARRIMASPYYGEARLGVHRAVAWLSIASPRAGVRLRPYFKNAIQSVRHLRDDIAARRAARRPDDARADPERAAVAAMVEPNRRLVQGWRDALDALPPAR